MDKLIVRNIIGAPVGSMSRVSLDIDNFMKSVGSTPAHPFKDVRDNGVKLREFTVDGATYYAFYDAKTRKTMFLMDTVEATKRLETMASKEKAEVISVGLSSFLASPEYTQPAVA